MDFISDPCTRFGINDGCKTYCPVLQDGECHLMETLDENMIWMIVDDDAMDFGEIETYCNMYPEYDETLTKLFPVWLKLKDGNKKVALLHVNSEYKFIRDKAKQILGV